MERGPIRGALFLNHGDDDARESMRDLLGKRGIDTSKIFMPVFDESFELTPGSQPVSQGKPEPRIDASALQTDWHNDYAVFMMDLSSKLDEIKDPKQRRALIARVATALND